VRIGHRSWLPEIPARQGDEPLVMCANVRKRSMPSSHDDTGVQAGFELTHGASVSLETVLFIAACSEGFSFGARLVAILECDHHDGIWSKSHLSMHSAPVGAASTVLVTYEVYKASACECAIHVVPTLGSDGPAPVQVSSASGHQRCKRPNMQVYREF
jgi:hypothetical protein